MSNYTKATNFTLKDGLVTGDVNKIIKGSELDAEYVSISNAISSKANLDAPTFTGVSSAPTATAGTASTQIASTAFVTAALAAIETYPVGSIYMNASVATNPATLLGFGTWTAFGAGRILLADGGGFTAGATGGTADAVNVSHTHTATSTSTVSDPGHFHSISRGYGASGAGGDALLAGGGVNSSTKATGVTVATSTSVASAGVSATNANLQPYIVVYMWKRTV